MFRRALSRHGFGAGDRLAILLPYGPEYIELVYACAWPNLAKISGVCAILAEEGCRIIGVASPEGRHQRPCESLPTVEEGTRP